MNKDFVNSHFPALGELNKHDRLPEYVKEANEITLNEVDALQSKAFADTRNRKFPLHSKSATYLSGLYYYGHSDPDAVVEDRIIKAADFFGISKDVSSIVESLGYLEKKASEDDSECYALVEDRGEARGGIQKYYPIRDDYEVVKSAREADKAFFDGRLPPEYFREVSLRLVKKAEELGLKDHELPRTVRENGQDRLPDWDRVKQAAVVSRKVAGVEEDGLKIYESIVEDLEKGGSVSEAEKLWNRMDQVCGVKYAKVPTFYELIYNGRGMKTSDLEKTAQENVVICDVVVPGNVLTSIPESKVNAYFEEKRAGKILDILESAKTDCLGATVKSAALEQEDAKTLLELALKWAQ